MTSFLKLTKSSTLLLKGIFALAFMLIINQGTHAQSRAQSKVAGEFSFDSKEIDYGSIQQHADGERVFVFTNTGNAPIVITNVRTSCGCTVPTYSKSPILPGKKGEIKVKYDTSRMGPFSKTITVSSNALHTKRVLHIKGTVIKPEHREADTE